MVSRVGNLPFPSRLAASFRVVIAALCATSCLAAEAAGRKEPARAAEAAADLCNEFGDVKYSAKWADGKVTLTATGQHRTGGVQVSFRQHPIEIFPPQFSLAHKRPTGIVTQAITPFVATTSFAAAQKPKAITVTDARGRQTVTVE